MLTISMIRLATKSTSEFVLNLLIPNRKEAFKTSLFTPKADITCEGLGEVLEQAELVEKTTWGKSSFKCSPSEYKSH